MLNLRADAASDDRDEVDEGIQRLLADDSERLWAVDELVQALWPTGFLAVASALTTLEEVGLVSRRSGVVIAKLAAALDTDAAELFRLAGRDVGGTTFERQVLSELQRLRRELRSGFDRLDAAIATSRTAKQRS